MYENSVQHRMLKLCFLALVVVSVVQVKGTNIILNKPSTQSTTWSGDYASSFANDGTLTTLPSHTQHELNPYWQGDLLGFYQVLNVSVTSDDSAQAQHLRNAFIGVSVHDVTCPDSALTHCGQWPDQYLPGQTLIFDCSHAGPVRFVRIWRNLESVDGLAIDEVEVEGTPMSLPGGSAYGKSLSKKISSLASSLSASSATDCAAICHRKQPCLAFSFSFLQQPNCLLANDVTMMSDVNWISYAVSDCISGSVC